MDDYERLTLPHPVIELLDGQNLEDKEQQAIQLASVDESGWIRQAMLSAGELLVVDDQELRLALYATSRTTQALSATGQGLLTLVVPDHVFRIQLSVRKLATAETQGIPHEIFSSRPVEVEEDRVGYAKVTHGIEFEARDPPAMRTGWHAKLELMRTVSA